MNDLQLATTLVAPTGTGLLYTAFEQGNDIAAFVNGSGASRSRIALKRVQAKPTPAYPGVERLNFKRTRYVTVAGVEYPVITDITTSIPVVVLLADRTEAHLHLSLMARDPMLKLAMESGAIPT